MRLILEDGTTYSGLSFGANRAVRGEVVFNTGMSGYVETLTDPSYRGQILVMTYPSIGNYGVPAERAGQSLDAPYESATIQVQGLVVQNYSTGFSHHAGLRSLGDWLKSQGIPAITGVDTRTLTRYLREAGTMPGLLLQDCGPHAVAESAAAVEMSTEVFRLVAPPAARRYDGGERTVLLVDVGAKDNIVRSLLARGVSVLRAPWHDDLMQYWDEVDGVLIGNGPGDPQNLQPLIGQVRQMLTKADKPVFGICLGNQILALAAGASTYKLPYGHRGLNQPVQDLLTRRSFITSQNHGYAVDTASLPAGWEAWFVNINDGTNEGIRCRRGPFRGVQFHPEACPGPEDTAFLFDDFVNQIN
ncbi:MAG: glutamine-hydrolyzing carbamoyl-phosphate synthase small subunit [Pseudomonadales bacterium]